MKERFSTYVTTRTNVARRRAGLRSCIQIEPVRCVAVRLAADVAVRDCLNRDCGHRPAVLLHPDDLIPLSWNHSDLLRRVYVWILPDCACRDASDDICAEMPQLNVSKQGVCYHEEHGGSSFLSCCGSLQRSVWTTSTSPSSPSTTASMRNIAQCSGRRESGFWNIYIT